MVLTRLINAQLRFQQAIAMGMLLLAGALAVGLFWITARTVIEYRHSLTELRERAGNLTAMTGMKSSLQPMNLDAAHLANQGLFFEAESLSIGRANLQSRIEAIAQSNNLVLASAGSVPDIDEKGIKLIGLRIDVTGSNEAVQNAIASIETARPPLLVRELALRLTSGEAQEGPVELAAQVKIYAAFRLAGTGIQPAAIENVGAP